MPVNESYGKEIEKRTKELEKRPIKPGGKNAAGEGLQEQQLAQNQWQVLENEKRNNLLAQKTESNAQDQANQLVNQAVALGVSNSTASTLGKYGLKSSRGPTVNGRHTQSRNVSVTPSKITIVNNTNTTTNTTNKVDTGGSPSGGGDNTSKFKTWLTRVNAQQQEASAKRDREYAKRESSLTRAANKMLRRIETVGKSVSEAWNPSTMGQTVGSQLKMFLLIFGMRFLAAYWDKVIDGVNWIVEATSNTIAWLGFGEKGEALQRQGKGLIPTIVGMFGGKPGKETVAEAFKKTLTSAFDHFAMKLDHMIELRAEAMKKVKLQVPSSSGLSGKVAKWIYSAVAPIMSSASKYIGDIMTALVSPEKALKNSVANDVHKIGDTGSKSATDRDNKSNNRATTVSGNTSAGDYEAFNRVNGSRRYSLTSNALTAGWLNGNIGGQVSQSMDILGVFRDARTTGKVDTARLVTGLERLQERARTAGTVAVDPEFLAAFFDRATMTRLINSGHIKAKTYKFVSVRKSDAELHEEIGSLGGDIASGAGIGAGAGIFHGGILPGAVAGGVIGAGVHGIKHLTSNGYTLKLVPMSDPRPAVYTAQVFEIDSEAVKTLARKYGASSFSASDMNLLRNLNAAVYSQAGGYNATRARWHGNGSNETYNIAGGVARYRNFSNLQHRQQVQESNSTFNQRLHRSGQTFRNTGQSIYNAGRSVYNGVVDFVTPGSGAGKMRTGYNSRTGQYYGTHYGQPSYYNGSNGDYGSPIAVNESRVDATTIPSTGGYNPSASIPSSNNSSPSISGGFVASSGGSSNINYTPILTKETYNSNRYGATTEFSGAMMWGRPLTPTQTDLTFNVEVAAQECLRLSGIAIYSRQGKGGKENPQPWGTKSTTQPTGGCSGHVRRAVAKGLGLSTLMGHPAAAKDYVDYLHKFGFKPIPWNKYVPRKGDILINGPIPGHPYGHASLNCGSCWCSDFQQRDMWGGPSFRKNKFGTVFRHLRCNNADPADPNINGTFIPNVTTGAGYIDFEGDGKYDAVQNEVGEIYRLNADGSMGDKMTYEDVNSLTTPNSTFSTGGFNAGTSTGSGENYNSSSGSSSTGTTYTSPTTTGTGSSLTTPLGGGGVPTNNGYGYNSASFGTNYTNTATPGPTNVGGKVTNPPQVNIQTPGQYNLVLWRYNKCSSGIGDGHSALEGVIYEHGTNKILTWTIEDDHDVRSCGLNKNPSEIVPGANGWTAKPGPGGYHYGCSEYTVKLSQGRAGFGSAPKQPRTMLTIKLPSRTTGCLFHPGKDTGWSTGCVLCGQKANKGKRQFNPSEYSQGKIFTSNDPAVRWWRNLYDHVIPVLCSGRKVYLYFAGQGTNGDVAFTEETDSTPGGIGGNYAFNGSGGIVPSMGGGGMSFSSGGDYSGGGMAFSSGGGGSSLTTPLGGGMAFSSGGGVSSGGGYSSPGGSMSFSSSGGGTGYTPMGGASFSSEGTGMTSGGGGLPSVSGGSNAWEKTVLKMKTWYENNIHTYHGTRVKPRKSRTKYQCPGVGYVWDDCSGFVSACLNAYGLNVYDSQGGKNAPVSRQYACIWKSSIPDKLTAGGFTKMPWSKGALRPFDITAGNGHVEIYAGGGKAYSWGGVHDLSFGGMPSAASFGDSTNHVIWRCTNAKSASVETDSTGGSMSFADGSYYGGGMPSMGTGFSSGGSYSGGNMSFSSGGGYYGGGSAGSVTPLGSGSYSGGSMNFSSGGTGYSSPSGSMSFSSGGDYSGGGGMPSMGTGFSAGGSYSGGGMPSMGMGFSTGGTIPLGGASYSGGSWPNCVQSMGKWFEANIHEYRQGGGYPCPLIGGARVRPDCTGFVMACMKMAGVPFGGGGNPDCHIGLLNLVYKSPSHARSQSILRYFDVIPYDKNQLQPFDVMSGDGHGEIYAGNGRSWSWGSCHDGMNGHQGMPAKTSWSAYRVILRWKGSGGGGSSFPGGFDYSGGSMPGGGMSFSSGGSYSGGGGMPSMGTGFSAGGSYSGGGSSVPGGGMAFSSANASVPSGGMSFIGGGAPSGGGMPSMGTGFSAGGSYSGGGMPSMGMGFAPSGGSGVKWRSERPQETKIGTSADKTYTEQNAMAMVNFLRSKGLPAHSAIGVAGSIRGETAYNPYHSGWDVNGPSGGIAAWHDKAGTEGNFARLKKFAAARGKPWTDIETQAEFLWYSLTEGSYKSRNIVEKLKNAKSIEEASYIWGHDYEVFKGYNDWNSPSHQRRMQYGRDLANIYRQNNEYGFNSGGGMNFAPTGIMPGMAAGFVPSGGGSDINWNDPRVQDALQKAKTHTGGYDRSDAGKMQFIRDFYLLWRSKGLSDMQAKVLIAQDGGKESVWGASNVAKRQNNFSGIMKSSSGSGAGKRFIWRTYNNNEDYINDKIRILNKVYPGSLQQTTPEGMVHYIQGGSPTKAKWCPSGWGNGIFGDENKYSYKWKTIFIPEVNKLVNGDQTLLSYLGGGGQQMGFQPQMMFMPQQGGGQAGLKPGFNLTPENVLMVGDSWGVGMKKYFKQNTSVGSTGLFSRSGRPDLPSVTDQINAANYTNGVIIVHSGGNDIALRAKSGGQAAVREDVQRAVAAAAAKGNKVIFIAAPWMNHSSSSVTGNRDKYNEWLRDAVLSTGSGFIDTNPILDYMKQHQPRRGQFHLNDYSGYADFVLKEAQKIVSGTGGGQMAQVNPQMMQQQQMMQQMMMQQQMMMFSGEGAQVPNGAQLLNPISTASTTASQLKAGLDAKRKQLQAEREAIKKEREELKKDKTTKEETELDKEKEKLKKEQEDLKKERKELEEKKKELEDKEDAEKEKEELKKKEEELDKKEKDLKEKEKELDDKSAEEKKKAQEEKDEAQRKKEAELDEREKKLNEAEKAFKKEEEETNKQIEKISAEEIKQENAAIKENSGFVNDYRFYGHEEHLDKTIKSMGDKNFAMSIWNQNPDLQYKWKGVGFDGWYDGFWKNLKSKEKVQYVNELEANDVYNAINFHGKHYNTKDNYSILDNLTYQDSRTISGKEAKLEDYDEDGLDQLFSDLYYTIGEDGSYSTNLTGHASDLYGKIPSDPEQRKKWFANFRANLSPEWRKEFDALLQKQKTFFQKRDDLRNFYVELSNYDRDTMENTLTDEQKKKYEEFDKNLFKEFSYKRMSYSPKNDGLLMSNDIDDMNEYSLFDEDDDKQKMRDLYYSLQVGDIETAKEILKGAKNTQKGETFGLGNLLAPNMGDDYSRFVLNGTDTRIHNVWSLQDDNSVLANSNVEAAIKKQGIFGGKGYWVESPEEQQAKLILARYLAPEVFEEIEGQLQNLYPYIDASKKRLDAYKYEDWIDKFEKIYKDSNDIESSKLAESWAERKNRFGFDYLISGLSDKDMVLPENPNAAGYVDKYMKQKGYSVVNSQYGEHDVRRYTNKPGEDQQLVQAHNSIVLDRSGEKASKYNIAAEQKQRAQERYDSMIQLAYQNPEMYDYYKDWKEQQANAFDLMKAERAQMYLTDGFESISDGDSFIVAQNKRERNAELAKLNKELSYLQTEYDYGEENYNARRVGDSGFEKEELSKRGVGPGAYKLWLASDEGKADREETYERILELMMQKEMAKGSTLNEANQFVRFARMLKDKDFSQIEDKTFSQLTQRLGKTKEDYYAELLEKSIKDNKEEDAKNEYQRTAALSLEDVKRRRIEEERNANRKGKDIDLTAFAAALYDKGSKFKALDENGEELSQEEKAKRYEELMATNEWVAEMKKTNQLIQEQMAQQQQDIVDNIANGTFTTMQGKALLTNLGLGDIVTTEQIKGAKKGQSIIRRVKGEDGKWHFYGMDGKEIQVKGEDGKMHGLSYEQGMEKMGILDQNGSSLDWDYEEFTTEGGKKKQMKILSRHSDDYVMDEEGNVFKTLRTKEQKKDKKGNVILDKDGKPIEEEKLTLAVSDLANGINHMLSEGGFLDKHGEVSQQGLEELKASGFSDDIANYRNLSKEKQMEIAEKLGRRSAGMKMLEDQQEYIKENGYALGETIIGGSMGEKNYDIKAKSYSIDPNLKGEEQAAAVKAILDKMAREDLGLNSWKDMAPDLAKEASDKLTAGQEVKFNAITTAKGYKAILASDGKGGVSVAGLDPNLLVESMSGDYKHAREIGFDGVKAQQYAESRQRAEDAAKEAHMKISAGGVSATTLAAETLSKIESYLHEINTTIADTAQKEFNITVNADGSISNATPQAKPPAEATKAAGMAAAAAFVPTPIVVPVP